MKIKLNSKQIEAIRDGLKETERRNFKTGAVPDVFQMLRYWSKSVGGADAKIASLTELPDGYLCRVNSKFRERMKAYLKEARTRILTEKVFEYRNKIKDEEMRENAEKYDQLIKEAERSRNAD